MTYKHLWSEVRRLRDDFNNYPQQILCHDLLLGPDCDSWNETEFRSFSASHARFDGVKWDKWVLWPNSLFASRYWSATSKARHDIRLFIQLAERGFSLLRAIRDMSSCAPLPINTKRIKYETPCNGISGVHIWLELVHEWAYRFPTLVLQGECEWWNYSGDDDEDSDEIAQRITVPDDGSLPYHSNPVCNTLHVPLFAASSGFLSHCLGEAVSLGFDDGPPEIVLPSPFQVPVWKAERGDLWFRGLPIKHYRRPAENQRKVLDEFQRQGWPNQIPNPWQQEANSFKTLDAAKDTVEAMNDNHLTHGLLHFGHREKGKAIYWQDLAKE